MEKSSKMSLGTKRGTKSVNPRVCPCPSGTKIRDKNIYLKIYISVSVPSQGRGTGTRGGVKSPPLVTLSPDLPADQSVCP